MTLVIGGFVAAVLLLIGFLIKGKKAYWLISGYNTMSAEKKKNVDTEGLGKLIGNMCFVLAILAFAGFALNELGQSVIANICFGMFIPVIVYIIIRAQKFDGNTRGPDGRMNVKSKWIIAVVIAFVMLVACGVGGLMYYSSRPAGYSLENGVLNISGMYGQEVRLSDVTFIQLLDEMPEVTYKSNGSGLGNVLKGNFTVKGIGRATLFVDTSIPPFIYLETETMTYFMNGADEERTRSIFEDIIAEWSKPE